MEQMMNNQEMTWMMICMIVISLFALSIGICVIIQTFLQTKILKEIRRIKNGQGREQT